MKAMICAEQSRNFNRKRKYKLYGFGRVIFSASFETTRFLSKDFGRQMQIRDVALSKFNCVHLFVVAFNLFS